MTDLDLIMLEISRLTGVEWITDSYNWYCPKVWHKPKPQPFICFRDGKVFLGSGYAPTPRWAWDLNDPSWIEELPTTFVEWNTWT